MEQAHVDIVLGGADSVNKWRKSHSEDVLDLSNADLKGKQFDGIKFGPVRLERAQLQGATFKGCVLFQADFRNAQLQGALLQTVNLKDTNLKGTDFSGAKLLTCDFYHAEIHHSVFAYANFSNCTFCGLLDCADFSCAELTKCTFNSGTLKKCNVWRTRFNNTALRGIGIEKLRNVHTCKGLEYATERQEEDQELGIDACEVPWHALYLGWEKIRAVGKLPLFGVSYVAVIAIPLFMYAIARCNDFLDVMTSAQHNLVEAHGVSIATHLPSLDHLKTPSQMLYALTSAVALAFATTLYHFRCPDRIKEYTREAWTSELGNQLVQYLPLSWRYEYVRWSCAFFYFIGFTFGLWVLLWKVGRAAVYIWQHSEFPLSPF
jgi:hypothetical protein